jgi:hypothetical protein
MSRPYLRKKEITHRIVTSRWCSQRDIVLGKLAPFTDNYLVQQDRLERGGAIIIRVVVRPDCLRKQDEKKPGKLAYFEDVDDVYIPFPNL